MYNIRLCKTHLTYDLQDRTVLTCVSWHLSVQRLQLMVWWNTYCFMKFHKLTLVASGVTVINYWVDIVSCYGGWVALQWIEWFWSDCVVEGSGWFDYFTVKPKQDIQRREETRSSCEIQFLLPRTFVQHGFDEWIWHE